MKISASSYRQKLGWFVVLVAVVLGTTVAASANSQSFQETVKGPKGSQTVTVNYSLTKYGISYTVTLSGASGSVSGSCGLFSKCSMKGNFQGIGSLAGFQEALSGSWNPLSLKNPSFDLSYFSAVPEESSRIELLCVLGLFALMMSRYSFKRSARV